MTEDLVGLITNYAEESNFEEMKRVFQHRTALGWSLPKLLVDTKQFSIMQHPAFDAVISKYWSGTSDLSAHMLHGSTTFALLMRTPTT